MLAKCTSPERGLGGAADDGVSETVGEVIALLTGEAQLGMVNVKDIGRGMGEGGVHSMTGLADMKEKPARRCYQNWMAWSTSKDASAHLLKDTNTAGLLRISERTGHLIDVYLWMKNCSKRGRQSPYLGVVGVVIPYLL